MMLQIKPILSALRRHKAGAVLIALQTALTLAIVCNALFIIQQRVAHLSAPSGIDEANLLVIENNWASKLSKDDADAQQRADLIALRQLPGVHNAIASNSYPMRGGGWDQFITLTPDQTTAIGDPAVYLGDEHFLDTLGVKLIAGRNFRPDEIHPIANRENVMPPVTIVTKALADKLFPDGSALGKSIYAMSSTPTVIVGIVDVLQTQSLENWQMRNAYQSLIWPMRQVGDAYYILRAEPGQLAAVRQAAVKALYAQNRMRIINDDGVLDYAQIRQQAYDSDHGMAVLMGIICVVLLAITAAGIVGLTSFWVGQRRKQIGVRRALGATKRDILSYFLTENLLIGIAGVMIGACLAIGMNLWMVSHFEMARLSLMYVLAGIVLLLLLGQGAVLAPAVRASRVSPVEATRSV
ncbi:FtsX-like permease family protein [Dyella sp. GSA-30]|uniref:ABC transporter permease n=1 Tax=Dyella sp. GSA-30 TaxID=2994496 RepID=UPI00249167C0|nr:FtsX-like permease family protein [Dyella sp. GSA-30]BDU20325.1 ABC transporter permease [Dyella sp. GSA-30]